MEFIARNEVSLTDEEVEAYHYFEDQLDLGYGIIPAADLVAENYDVGPDFLDWLVDKTNGRSL